MYSAKLKQDLQFGLQMEINNFDKFKSFLNCPDLKQTKQNHIFDYESDDHLVELKTRRCCSTTYKDTMIPLNKIDHCKTTTKEVFFFFHFTDGLFYWKYTDDDFKKCRLAKGGRVDRSRLEIKPYCYIPYDLLTPL